MIGRLRLAARMASIAALGLGGGALGNAALADEAGEALIAAARKGNTSAALTLIDSGADVATTAPDNTTALHWAANAGDLVLVEALIEAGADVEAVNDYGVLPLSAGAVSGNARVLEAILDAGAEPDAHNADGQTALMIVARGGNTDAARVLIDAGADVNARERWRGQTAAMWAAAQGRADMLTVLHEGGADLDAKAPAADFKRQVSAEPRAQYRPFGGMTAFLYAAREGCVECARSLIAAGADMNLPDARAVTPLVMALTNAHFDFARVLVEAGADPDQWDWWGRSPLYAAVDLHTTPDGGRPDRPPPDTTTGVEIAAMLLEAGANPNAQLKLFPPYRHPEDDRGCDQMLTTGATALLRAAKVFDSESIAVLLEHGAEIDRPNIDGMRPIMAAAGLGSVECDIRGGYLDENVEQRSIAALQLLVDAGADVNARVEGRGVRYSSPTGRTALHGAAFWGWNDVVRFLVDHGARIDALDDRGLSPIDAAMGRAGGHGRGQDIQVFEDTAELLRSLCMAQSECEIVESE